MIILIDQSIMSMGLYGSKFKMKSLCWCCGLFSLNYFFTFYFIYIFFFIMMFLISNMSMGLYGSKFKMKSLCWCCGLFSLNYFFTFYFIYIFFFIMMFLISSKQSLFGRGKPERCMTLLNILNEHDPLPTPYTTYDGFWCQFSQMFT